MKNLPQELIPFDANVDAMFFADVMALLGKHNKQVTVSPDEVEVIRRCAALMQAIALDEVDQLFPL